MRFTAFLLILIGCCEPQCSADTYALVTSYVVDGQKIEDKGTAVCFAHTDRGSLVVTAAHNVQHNPDSVWISHQDDWHLCDRVHVHPSADIAVLEISRRLRVTPLGDVTPIGESVVVQGFGPRLNHSGESLWFDGTIEDSENLRGANGEHAIPGDSGGPVLYETEAGLALVGIVTRHEGDRPANRRTQFASFRARTGFVPAQTIVSFVQAQYGGCPGGVCPIRIRPQIQRPMIGIGIPIGPPRIVDTVEPAPRILQPSPKQPGPQGPSGPPGRDGRSVTKAEVEAAVNAWLDAHFDQLKGPPGPSGRDGGATDVTQLERRLSALERRPFRMVLTSDGEILDDEEYAPGEPVVLDLKRLRKSSDAK